MIIAKIIIVIIMLIMIILVSLLFRFGMWKLLPKEGKVIMIILLAYILINRITDIATDNILLRTEITVISTTIYVIILLVVFMRFYKKIKDKINEEKDVRLQ